MGISWPKSPFTPKITPFTTFSLQAAHGDVLLHCPRGKATSAKRKEVKESLSKHTLRTNDKGFHGDRVYRGWPVFRLAFLFYLYQG